MPPTMVHVNGSVNFEDAETVMRELATRVPQLRRIPDGETGERKIWIAFQSEKFQNAGGLEPVPRGPEEVVGELDEETVRLADGVEPDAIAWPDLGFGAFYRDSYATFQRLADEGVIGPQTRFQVEYPTPLASATTYVDRADVLRVEGSYEKALLADLDALLAAVPNDRIAVQLDMPVEVGVLELPEAFSVSPTQTLEFLAANVARFIDHIPADVPVGLHLCYGDYMHRHWKEPESLEVQVRLLNAIAAATERTVDWCAFTVPQNVTAPAYFAPLADVAVDADATELYLALVPYHPETQAPGTTEAQVALVDELLGDRPWGICAECGLVNVERDELPALLDLHSDLIERHRTASAA